MLCGTAGGAMEVRGFGEKDRPSEDLYEGVANNSFIPYVLLAVLWLRVFSVDG